MPGGNVAMCHLEKSAAWATIVLFGITNIALADSGWSWRNPLPTGAYLSAAAAVDANTACFDASGDTWAEVKNQEWLWPARAGGERLATACVAVLNGLRDAWRRKRSIGVH
jgi:hypothetical protein